MRTLRRLLMNFETIGKSTPWSFKQKGRWSYKLWPRMVRSRHGINLLPFCTKSAILGLKSAFGGNWNLTAGSIHESQSRSILDCATPSMQPLFWRIACSVGRNCATLRFRSDLGSGVLQNNNSMLMSLFPMPCSCQ